MKNGYKKRILILGSNSSLAKHFIEKNKKLKKYNLFKIS